MKTSPFSILNPSGCIRLFKILEAKGLSPKLVTHCIWAGNVVHLFTRAGGVNPALTVAVKDFA